VSGARERLEAFSPMRCADLLAVAGDHHLLPAFGKTASIFRRGFDHGYPWMFVLALGLWRAPRSAGRAGCSPVGDTACAAIYATAFAVNLPFASCSFRASADGAG
jgi:hypothetical protein